MWHERVPLCDAIENLLLLRISQIKILKDLFSCSSPNQLLKTPKQLGPINLIPYSFAMSLISSVSVFLRSPTNSRKPPEIKTILFTPFSPHSPNI